MLLPPLVPQIAQASTEVSANKGDNPLIWPLLSVLQQSPQGWKVHHLASELQSRGLMHNLDPVPEKDLFKRNFLLMNALFELQDMLLPGQWLQAQAMDIRLLRIVPANVDLILHQEAGLKSYYLDWGNYDTSTNVVRDMLESFWNSYQSYIGINGRVMHQTQALRVLELDISASDREIRRQWRKLALKWHPDRPEGDAARFREVCEAWQALRGRSGD
ncbi:J domain-containing protein [Shewanella sp. JM162201]|uniref:J domain-containing protein n=1 Tax=Shewanella jiangmenensis TaxID=2837387 RepID=A0ABS5V1S6_9GAMM|nr:DNA-J related domain-containing protein [Shewanella jiangmenensis]MBT1443741.1 J domain-containing protein [Shewanella jiangmenensis]